MSNILHSNATAEWYSPQYIVEASRHIMGGITLDPASCTEANEIVKADFIWTKEHSGLANTWTGNVFLNPPSRCDGLLSCEKRCTCKLPRKFMHRMFEMYYEGPVMNAIYIGFNIGQLKYLEDEHFHSDDVRFVIPRKRIKFWQPGVEKNNPTQDNFILLLSRDLKVRTRFDDVFGTHGQVWQSV